MNITQKILSQHFQIQSLKEDEEYLRDYHYKAILEIESNTIVEALDATCIPTDVAKMVGKYYAFSTLNDSFFNIGLGKN